MPAAGVTEVRGPEFRHHYHSDNTQDIQPHPNSMTQQVGMPQRAFPSLPVHAASVTRNDFMPLADRK